MSSQKRQGNQPPRSRQGARKPPPPPRDRRFERPVRTSREQRRQRLAIVMGIAIILVVFGVIAYGYYANFVAPPRRLAAQVRDTKYTQGDLVDRLRLIQATQGTVDLSTAPFSELNAMVEAELLRQGASFIGVSVTGENIDQVLRDQFYPDPPEGQEVPQGQLETEFRENYRSFLNEAQISDNEYRRLIAENLYRVGVREKLAENIPANTEHVRVNWILLPTSRDTDPQNPPPTSADVLERLKTEDFSVVAREVSQDSLYDSNRDGEIGWVPKNAFPELDEVLFGSEDQEPLATGEISEPIFTDRGTFIVQVTEGPEEREVDQQMLRRLKDSRLNNWLLEQRSLGVQEGWLEMNFDSDLYSWVVDQLRSRPTPTPAGGGTGQQLPG